MAIFSLKIPNFQFWNYFGPFEVQFDPSNLVFLYENRKITSLKVDGRMIQTVYEIFWTGFPADTSAAICRMRSIQIVFRRYVHFVSIETSTGWIRLTRPVFGPVEVQSKGWTTQNCMSSPYFRGPLVLFLLLSPNFCRPAVLCPTRDLFRTKDPYFPRQRNSVSFLSFLKV